MEIKDSYSWPQIFLEESFIVVPIHKPDMLYADDSYMVERRSHESKILPSNNGAWLNMLYADDSNKVKRRSDKSNMLPKNNDAWPNMDLDNKNIDC